jgi:hypothetical protein
VRIAWRWLGLICGGALLAAPLRAAEDTVDPEFLEFLGTVDSSEVGWQDYLAATDVDQAAKAKSGSAQPGDSGSPSPASTIDKVGQP